MACRLSDSRAVLAPKIPTVDLSEHDRLREMLKNLLKERFKLAVHFEKKEVPGHELVVARDGVKMKEA